jgi:hypothetical protein
MTTSHIIFVKGENTIKCNHCGLSKKLADGFLPIQEFLKLGEEFAEKHKECKEDDQLQDRTCRVCGCTDDDCRQCINKTGEPCSWIENDLCSACEIEGKIITALQRLRGVLLSTQAEIDIMRSIDLPKLISKKGVKLLAQASGHIDNADTKVSHAIAEFNTNS